MRFLFLLYFPLFHFASTKILLFPLEEFKFLYFPLFFLAIFAQIPPFCKFLLKCLKNIVTGNSFTLVMLLYDLCMDNEGEMAQAE